MIPPERLAWIKLPEDLLILAVEQVCGQPPTSVGRLESSFSNDVYRVEVDGRTVCARSHRGEPGYFAREGWARRTASAAGVPIPSLLGVAEVTADVHYSVSIEEWIDAELLYDILRADPERGCHLATSVGEAAARLHSVTFEGPGTIDATGSLDVSAWTDHLTMGDPEELADLAESVGMPRSDVRVAAMAVNTDAFDVKTRQAVLLHGDLASKHALVDDRLAALIDFEFPQSGEAAEDFAYWSYCERDNGSIDSFLVGYGQDSAELRRTMLLHRLRISLQYLRYSAPRGELVGEFRDWVASSLAADIADL